MIINLKFTLYYNMFNYNDDTDNPDIVPWHRGETGPTRSARSVGDRRGLTTGVGRLIGQRLHDITHPTSFPAGALFGTIAATGPASLADTRRAYQQSIKL